MLGRAFDQARPLALALRQVGGRDQLAQRENAIQRGAELVRQDGECALDRIESRGRPARTHHFAPLARRGFRTF